LGAALILVGIWMLAGKDIVDIALPKAEKAAKGRREDDELLRVTGASELGEKPIRKEIREGKRPRPGPGRKTGSVRSPVGRHAGESFRYAKPVEDTSDIPF